MKTTERVEIAFRMLYRIAPYWGDMLGLVWNFDKTIAARRIIAKGPSCNEWESTRLEIRLSHDEAIAVGEKITRFDEVSEIAPRYTIGDYLDRFNHD